MLLTATLGKENLPGAMCTFQLFVMPSRAFPIREEQVGMYAKKGREIRAVGSPSFTSAGINLRQEVVGQWVQGNYDIREGIILKLTMFKSVGGIRRDGAYLLQARDSAALLRFEVLLSQHSRASRHSASIEGRFDILSPSEAIREGVSISPLLHRQLLAAEPSNLFTTTSVRKETSKRPTVAEVSTTNTEGENVVVPVRKRLRMIDV